MCGIWVKKKHYYSTIFNHIYEVTILESTIWPKWPIVFFVSRNLERVLIVFHLWPQAIHTDHYNWSFWHGPGRIETQSLAFPCYGGFPGSVFAASRRCHPSSRKITGPYTDSNCYTSNFQLEFGFGELPHWSCWRTSQPIVWWWYAAPTFVINMILLFQNNVAQNMFTTHVFLVHGNPTSGFAEHTKPWAATTWMQAGRGIHCDQSCMYHGFKGGIGELYM